MKFDVTKIYTGVNATDVVLGSVGYFADTISKLRRLVETEAEERGTLEEVLGEDAEGRFNGGGFNYAYFYFLSEPKFSIKTSRPYLNTEEMIEDFKERNGLKLKERELPIIWIKNKRDYRIRMIHSFEQNGDGIWTLEEFFNEWTYLDGSVIGKEKE